MPRGALDLAEVDAVAYRIRRRWDVRQTSDYRLFGKPVTAYRALHLIVMRRERLVEVQLRTMGQQYWAEAVESTSSRTGFNLKDGHGPPELLEYFRVASDITWEQENGEEVDELLSDRLEDLRPQVARYFRPDERPRRGRGSSG